MAGRLVEAWDYTWAELWQPLASVEDAPADLLAEVFLPLTKALRPFPEPRQVSEEMLEAYTREYAAAKGAWIKSQSDACNDAGLAAEQLQLWVPGDFKGDNALARAFEEVFETLGELDCPELQPKFFDLTERFLRCHNIRYRLLSPFELRPHAAGLFSTLVHQIEAKFAEDRELLELLNEFEHALKNAGRTYSAADIKTCIGKASNLAEGISKRHPQAKGDVFTDHCKSVKCWPHDKLKAVFDSIYGFCSGYPGIRHAGSQHGVRRELDPRDGLVSALVLLSSAGYFMDNLDLAEIVG